jgi:hypothetical protein
MSVVLAGRIKTRICHFTHQTIRYRLFDWVIWQTEAQGMTMRGIQL